MRGRLLALAALPLLLAGCGKYGPPVRAHETPSAATAAPAAGAPGSTSHPAGCTDPAHAHPEAGAGGVEP